MKKITPRTWLLAACSLAGAAHGQSGITVYGIVDAAVTATDPGGPASARVMSLSSGIMSGSLFGLQGKEELGGGMHAVFQLEASYESDTGAMKTYYGNPSTATPAAPGGAPVTGLFNRRAFVGLEGRFGSLALGRNYTPIYFTVLDGDSLKFGSYGNMQSVVLLSGTGSDRFGRASNALFYAAPRLGTVQARLMASLGAESGGAPGSPPGDANRMWGVSLSHDARGLTVSGAYQRIALPLVAGAPLAFTGRTGTRSDTAVAARYVQGGYTLSGGYFRALLPTPRSDGDALWLGGAVRMGADTLSLNLQRLRQQALPGGTKQGTGLGLAYMHALSKRSTLYASYGQMHNQGAAAFSVLSGDTAVAPAGPGAFVRALALGTRHLF